MKYKGFDAFFGIMAIVGIFTVLIAGGMLWNYLNDKFRYSLDQPSYIATIIGITVIWAFPLFCCIRSAIKHFKKKN